MSVELDSEDPVVNFGEPLNHVMTLRGPFMVSRKLAIRDEPHIRQNSLILHVKNTRPYLFLLPVCPFKTSPCVLAPLAHVSTHVRVVPVNTGTFWTDTRGRVEWTHGIFQRATSDHTRHTHHNTPQQHDRNNTRRQRHAETEKERERQRKKTEKTRQQKREERRFIFSVVVHGRFYLMECFVL